MKSEQKSSVEFQQGAIVEVAVIPWKLPDVTSRTVETVIGVTGYEITRDPNSAAVVICFQLDHVVEYLKKGKAVLHLTGMGGSTEPCVSALRDPAWSVRYRHVDCGIPSLLDMLIGLNQLVNEVNGNLPDISPTGAELGLPAELKKSELRDKRILVLDDTEKNRQSASWQFGDTNTIDIFSSYRSAVEALRDESYDVVLLDLLMQPEAFMLSNTAYAKVAGSEFSAGSIVALVASLRPGTDVTVVTDASHHDHPATALLDYLWDQRIAFANGSSLTFRRAVTMAVPGSEIRIKDWNASLAINSQ